MLNLTSNIQSSKGSDRAAKGGKEGGIEGRERE
jgi:hypothetical protein